MTNRTLSLANLEDETKSPQTLKVIFAGCHDSGYLSTLRSLITAGYKDKLVLMPGYKEMAAGYSGLDLPLLIVPDLFEPSKLCAPTPSMSISSKDVTAAQAKAGFISESSPLKSPSAYATVLQHNTTRPWYRRG